MSAYQNLFSHFEEIAALSGASSILYWDNSVLLPKGAREDRANQLTVLARLSHQRKTDPRVGDWLAEAQSDASLDDWQQANLREMERAYRNNTCMPADLVEAKVKADSECEAVWREAREKSDFKMVQPLLAEVLRLTQEEAKVRSEASGLGLYDALLDLYEPDGRTAEIDPIFADYKAFLPDFLSQVLDAQDARTPVKTLRGPFDIAAQEALGREVMGTLGFNFDNGRLDVSTHPFCGGTPADVRMTTRYDGSDFTSSLMGVIHETGHGLYEQGLPHAYRSQPVGHARGMALHESQSLFMEMQVGRSRAFLKYLTPKMQAAFDGNTPAWTAENLYRTYTRVNPGYIRVDADEVTYPAHVILRYELEQKLLSGDLPLVDLPDAWNQGLYKLLGLVLQNDRLGCLQDIHWYSGAIGYFPTYTLGAMSAAQLAAAARKAMPDFDEKLAQGDLAPILNWLRGNVHAKASSASSKEIMAAATGSALTSDAFKAHLKARYLA